MRVSFNNSTSAGMGEAASNLPARLNAARASALRSSASRHWPSHSAASPAPAVVGSEFSPEGVCLFQRRKCIGGPALLESRSSQTRQGLRMRGCDSRLQSLEFLERQFERRRSGANVALLNVHETNFGQRPHAFALQLRTDVFQRRERRLRLQRRRKIAAHSGNGAAHLGHPRAYRFERVLGRYEH